MGFNEIQQVDQKIKMSTNNIHVSLAYYLNPSPAEPGYVLHLQTV